MDYGSIIGGGLSAIGGIAGGLFRDTDDAADTYNSAAALLSVGLHYQVDRIGSKEISTK